jgi:hypothetical protein
MVAGWLGAVRLSRTIKVPAVFSAAERKVVTVQKQRIVKRPALRRKTPIGRTATQ